MTMFGNRAVIGARRSLSRKCASISPTSLASSFASAIRAGATQRFGWLVDGRTTSSNVTSFSAIASYTLRVIWVTSRNDIVLLAWGSRSTSRVGLPRRDSAAARLIAVVVLPTPPFWFAIATIILDGAAIIARHPTRRGHAQRASAWGQGTDAGRAQS